MGRRKKDLLFIFLLILIFISCEKNTTPLTRSGGPAINVTLTAEYVGVSDAELCIKLDESLPNTRFQLFRDDSLLQEGELLNADTLLYDEGLLPAHNYTYRAFLINDGRRIAQSAGQNVTTMDTTSHNFQWETFEIPSPYGSGALYDVAVVNENDIWAVGQIYSDSAQPWLPYNAVHWDGQQWEVKRIQVFYNGSYIIPVLNGIYAFSENDIWVTSGVPKHWDGQNWTQYHLWDMGVLSQEDGGVTKIWGSSPNNVYFVGRGGTIVRYDGQSWQKLESGTDLPITDIWGVEDSETGEPIVLCTATEKFDVSDHKIFKIGPAQGVSEINWPFADRRPYSVWFKTLDNLFICGDGVFRIDPIRQYQLFTGLPTFFKERIRGNDINDIYSAGDFGLLAHYNGLTWWTQPNSTNDIFRGLDVKGNLTVAVGEKDHNALIIMLTRE